MNELIYNKSFNEWETELKTEITRAADSFVRIGYLLKVARDTDILQGSGYSNVVEYARAKYGLDKTQVSRFISINDRFGVEGSPELQERYKEFGYSKLALMLQLPDEINEELSPDYSKSEINAIKTELDEESKISDLEVYAESKEVFTQDYNLLEQCIYKICEDNIDTYKRLHKAITTVIGVGEDNIVELLAPAGEKIYSVRIAGVGRMAVSVKKDDDIHTINMRSNEKESWTLEAAVRAVVKVIDTAECDTKTAWQQLYNQPWPEDEKAEVAPAQQSPVPRKEKKVATAKVNKEKPKPVEPPKPIEPVKAPEPEEQLPGQDTILNHPEYMPEDKAEMPTNAIKTEFESDSKEVIDVPARVVEETDIKSSEMNTQSSGMITDKPNFEADMAAVESINEKEESDTDIRDGIIAMALNIAGVLQDRVNDDKISLSMLNTLHSTSINISDKLEVLMRRGEDNE